MVDSSDEDSTELLEKLKHLDVRTDLEANEDDELFFKDCCESVKWKSAFNHIGLFISFSIYVGVGGLVSECENKINEFCT